MKTVYDVLREKIKEHTTAQSQSMSRGLPDFAAYRESCGVIRGLTLALQEIEDLARINREDEDE